MKLACPACVQTAATVTDHLEELGSVGTGRHSQPIPTPMAGFVPGLLGISYTEDKKIVGTTTADDEEMKLLFGAGLMGARSWLRYKVRKKQDPAWSRDG